MSSDSVVTQTLLNWRERLHRWLHSRLGRRVLAGTAFVMVLAVLIVGAFPVGMAGGWIERRLSAELGTPVSIGKLSREPFFSFTPTIVISDLRIAQPKWAGQGDLARARELRLRIAFLPALIGRGLKPDSIEAHDVSLALLRDKSGRANWRGRGGGGGGKCFDLSDLSITRGTFTLKDERRHLILAGALEANQSHGLLAQGSGRFHDAPIEMTLNGEPIAHRTQRTPYAFRLRMVSPLIDLEARGRTMGALNTADMSLAMAVRAPSLTYLDDIVQAGLFGTQPIDLKANVRHQGRDWFVDRLNGSVGGSRLTGRATILKRDGRSKIDATIAFGQLDIDDLADDAARAADTALEARIGNRVLPNTPINLAKVGPTDGTIRFSAAQLLFKSPSVFRSMSGTISLNGKVLRVDNIEAGLVNGRMTGSMLVDHRTGASPRLDLDLQFRDGRLGALLGMSDRIDAPFGARIALSGRGDTIRNALAQADGHVGFVAGNGQLSRTIAAVLAQDMGKAVGAAFGDKTETVPLRCIAVGFSARGGHLVAAPFLIETAESRSRGEGEIDLQDEQIGLTVGGMARHPSGLPLVDPIRIGGTLSAPTLDVVPPRSGGILGAVVRSFGSALGLTEKQGPEVVARGPVDCLAISKSLLTIGLPARH